MLVVKSFLSMISVNGTIENSFGVIWLFFIYKIKQSLFMHDQHVGTRDYRCIKRNNINLVRSSVFTKTHFKVDVMKYPKEKLQQFFKRRCLLLFPCVLKSKLYYIHPFILNFLYTRYFIPLYLFISISYERAQ